MTRAQLNRILNPESVAVIGASSRENNLGHWLLKAILNGGYEGKVFTVNPKGGRILGLEVMTDIESLPSPIDLAVLSIPAPAAPQVLKELGEKKPAGAVVVAGGFAETGPEGKAMQEELKRIAGQSGIRLIGPNTIGFANMHAKLNASFSPEMGGSPPGNIGVVSQSGSVCETLYFRCLERGAGFSSLIAAGNEADLDMCDYLEYLLEDERTSVIALYVEQIRRPGRFVELLKKRQNRKPVVMFRTGRTSAGKLAAASHTGAMAGDDAIMKGVCRQLDVADARSYDDLIDTAVAFSGGRFPKGRRLAVVTGPRSSRSGRVRRGRRDRIGNGRIQPRNIRSTGRNFASHRLLAEPGRPDRKRGHKSRTDLKDHTMLIERCVRGRSDIHHRRIVRHRRAG